MVNDNIDKVVFGKNPPVKKSSENAILFVATYHPKVKNLGKLIKDLFPNSFIVTKKFRRSFYVFLMPHIEVLGK